MHAVTSCKSTVVSNDQMCCQKYIAWMAAEITSTAVNHTEATTVPTK